MALLDTPICDFGKAAPDFSLPDVVSGKSFSLQDVRGERGVLIAFICNHCPYVQAVVGELVATAEVLRGEGVGVGAIMSNNFVTHPADAPERMKEFAGRHGFSFPYLLDESQEIAKAYDAVCTPDFFGYDGGLGLQYRGTAKDGALREAMLGIAETGKGPSEQVPSMGCSIKWR
ncbi:MAG: thioredoxin family protein [Parvibaculales bacterium]